MQDPLCELRFDIPLVPRGDAAAFERAWRAQLAAQKMTALAMPPAEAVAARFCICGADGSPDLGTYLAARLAALPGQPKVAGESGASSPDWSGVRIWLSYRSRDLATLLHKTKKSGRTRGHRS